MALNITVQDRGIARALSRMAAQLRDMTPVYRAIGSALERNANLRFDLKEAPDGTAWRPWAPSTAAARAAEGRGTLLEYTGRMRASLTHIASRQGVEVGFGVDYAQYHEKTRPLLTVGGDLGEDDKKAVLAAAMREFSRAFSAQTP